ncbi:MAG: Mg2+ and Co2+ transporter CorC [Candidatus Tokpelaia hoelldobleri]|uniref:Mg2+ and Co2+ transporter CorC n=1 Tax=Candidatus Tokpelaia hoelldobleri TaxID=1902579 RepID=A0A1U9JWB0_9HYPH|nr:MAG: Mg2+ and Co2+ transporter CorC [Candidatus Tokpelaia hoelldoblerii]
MADKKRTQSAGTDSTGANATDTDGHSPQPLQSYEKRSRVKGLFTFLRSRQNNTLQKNQLDHILSSEFGDTFSPQERLMVGNIVKLHQARVDDVMIPRSEIEAIEIDTTLAKALHLFEQSGHSRMPVYAQTLDDPRGMIHMRDLLNYITLTAQGDDKKRKPDMTRIDLARPVSKLGVIREVLFVPGSMPASQLFARMQATHIQMALVIDEHGGTDGLASMEDIVELVVGDIEDEHDDEDVMIVHESKDCWLLDAGAELEDVEAVIGSSLNAGAYAEDIDTIGGLVVSVLDRIPTRGETIEAIPGFRFQIVDADRRKIRRLRMWRVKTDHSSDNT